MNILRIKTKMKKKFACKTKKDEEKFFLLAQVMDSYTCR